MEADAKQTLAYQVKVVFGTVSEFQEGLLDDLR